MHPIAFGIIIILFIVGFLFLIYRSSIIKNMNRALKNNDTDLLIAMSKKKFLKMFLNEYTCDLYIARSYFNNKDESSLLKHLRMMMRKTYESKDEEQYLSLYYHYYVHVRNKEVAMELLEKIKQTQNTKFLNYRMWTKTVLFDEVNTICADIDAAIEQKDYYGFPLATCSYLIGVQKKRLGIHQDAIEWLETALDVFMDQDIYVSDVKKEVDELHQLGYFSKDLQRKRK